MAKKSSFCAWLPVLGLACFAILIVIAHVLRPDVDMVTKTVSHYARGRYRWLAISAFIIQGSSMVLLAALMQKRLRPSSYWGTGPLAIAGVSVIVLGIFPIDPTPQDFSVIGGIHRYATITDTCATLVAMVYWTRYFGNHRQRRIYHLSFVLFTLAWTSSVLMFATGGEPVLGITQRISIVMFWAWFNMAAIALLSERRWRSPSRSALQT